MIPWNIGTILGSVALAVKNSMSRVLDLTFLNFIYMQVPLVLAGVFYWYGFRHAPKFINCWFLGTAFNAIFAILLGLILFDKTISYSTSAAIIMILTGIYLLMR